MPLKNQKSEQRYKSFNNINILTLTPQQLQPIIMSIPYIASPDQFQSALQRSEALIVYFTAVWCGPCQAIAPIVEKLYTSFTNIDVFKVDLDSNKALASQQSISAVPTFILFHKGKEISRIQGANIQALNEGFKKLSDLAPNAKRQAVSSTNESSSSSGGSNIDATIAKYVPKGFQILNDSIFFGDFESLNTVAYDHSNKDLKNFIRSNPDTESSNSIISDADEQLLLHIPLTNLAKIYSILIKFKSPTKKGEVEIDEVQKPKNIKVWNNRTSIISFEDVDSFISQHEEELLDNGWDSNGWYEIKLKYVRFQKVSSIDLFIDGDDDELHTLIDKIVIIGVDGESKNQGKIEKLGDE